MLPNITKPILAIAFVSLITYSLFTFYRVKEKSLSPGSEQDPVVTNDISNSKEKDEASPAPVEIVTPVELEKNGFVKRGSVFVRDQISMNELQAFLGFTSGEMKQSGGNPAPPPDRLANLPTGSHLKAVDA